MTELSQFSHSIDIAAPPRVVFTFLTTEEGMTAWMGQFAELDPRQGGRFAVDISGYPVRGQYLHVEPFSRVVVSWGFAGSDDLPPGASTVEFRLIEIEGGTRVELTHSDLPDSEVPGHAEGWRHFVPRLHEAAEGGHPGPDSWLPRSAPKPASAPTSPISQPSPPSPASPASPASPTRPAAQAGQAAQTAAPDAPGASPAMLDTSYSPSDGAHPPTAAPASPASAQPATSALSPAALATPYSPSPKQPPTASTPPSPGNVPPDPREQARSTSLLTEITNEAPAATGLRGALNQFGLHLGPTERERAERADAAAVSQHWAGPRTIAVVNGKGGATKTPTAILLSAIFARYGGAGVIAYDNNSTRGTLGWRTQQGPHDATVIDLLPHVGHLLSPQAQAAEISGFVHHQREDRYDVLRSRPEVLADAKPGDADSFDAIHSVLTKYYRLVVIDSGNDESSPQWRAMIARADAIVVPTTTRPDHAESARLLLAELAGANAHAARLAENALVVVSQGSKGEPEPSQLVSTFQGIARAAVGIPYDPAMAGRPLILDSLAPPARRAWLRAGTALAMGLA